MKRYMPLVLVAMLALVSAQASANLIINGSFEQNNFNGWTIGTTSNGTWGEGFPIVAPWPLGGGLNAAKGEVGEVNFDGTQQGGTLSQAFMSGAGAGTVSMMYAAMGDGIHTNSDGGEFTLMLDNTILAQFDVGTITANQIISGTLSANVNLSAGPHTLEIDVTRRFASQPQNTPYQYVTGVDVEGPSSVPEPGSLVLMGSGVLGLAGMLRRKLGF